MTQLPARKTDGGKWTDNFWTLNGSRSTAAPSNSSGLPSRSRRTCHAARRTYETSSVGPARRSLNIAEASGKTSVADRARFHAIARGSAFECAAILDVPRLLETARPDDLDRGKRLPIRVVSMLSKMCR